MAMVRVSFTANLRRHVDCEPRDVKAGTLRAVLDEALPMGDALRGYVLDERGGLRKHITVFLGADAVRDRARLSDDVAPGTEVWAMQALSGG